jgi:hypothetical protein
MSAIATFADRFKGYAQEGVLVVKTRFLGANNERLDFLMDSFYKLSPHQRTGALAGVVGFIGLFVLGAIILYFHQVSKLKSDLNNSIASLHELRTLKSAYADEKNKFEGLITNVQAKTRGLKMKPFFEQIANDLGVKIDDLKVARQDAAAAQFDGKIDEVHVDMRLPKISIPRLLNFMEQIEKANKFLRIDELQISGIYGTRLFFNAKVKIRGYNAT